MKKRVPANLLSKHIRGLDNQLLEASRRSWNLYLKNKWIKHFKYGNTALYNYTPNSLKTEQKKKTKWGFIKPQLVDSGKLKAAAQKSIRVKVNRKSIRLTVMATKYGDYQIKAGRDWINPNLKDLKWITKQTKRQLKLIRNTFRNI
jgi:hypothetical protein